ncbi:MAG: cyanophycinase [Bryobacterales bacterium]|nr:cyanophycinase [Bryobacterales bacterium]
MANSMLGMPLATAVLMAQAADPAYQLFLTGDAADVQPRTMPGFVLAGGSKDQDAAMRWFLERSGGGDIVVIRAGGADGYNDYLYKLGKVNSVETILFRSREAAADPVILDKIRKAEGLFIAGGDQWNYLRFWKGTPVQQALQELIDRGVPIGGTSAGLAVLGEYIFSAEFDTVQSKEALTDPFDKKVAIARDFLRVPNLGCLITDSHFTQRNRMGRLLVFLARMQLESPCKQARGVGVDERTAVLLERDGSATVVGEGAAHFVRLRTKPVRWRPQTPVEVPPVDVYSVDRTGRFHVKKWKGSGGQAKQLTVKAGKVL